MSRGISEGNYIVKFANTSNRGRVCLFSQNETTILIMQNVQMMFCQLLRHYILLAVLTCIRSLFFGCNNHRTCPEKGHTHLY